MIKVGIMGANGYTGFELLRLLASHKNVEVVFCGSRSLKDTKIRLIYPSLGNYYKDMLFDDADPKLAAKKCDVVFSALPHGASAEMCSQIIEDGAKVIDLSADFRYDDLELYEKIYGVKHPNPKLASTAVYGLTEINREKIRKARIVGNPGCYTTSSILALLPLIKNGLIENKNIIIDAKSGASGAGRKAEVSYSFCELDENFKAYAIGTHRHTSEIEEKLSVNGNKMQLSFTPHLLPIKRGILSTIYANIKNVDENEIAKAYNKFYKDETFINICSDGSLPTIQDVVSSNTCSIGYKIDKRLGRIVIVSCLDNLIKGASGQAIQNMNVMFGFDEAEALPVVSLHL